MSMRVLLAASLFLLSSAGQGDPVSGAILWSAGMESGDLREWYSPCTREGSCPAGAGGGEYNTLDGDSVASRDHAHSGSWSVKQTISASTADGHSSATRLARWSESVRYPSLYYSVWYFIPQRYTVGPGGYLNWFQYKSATGDGKSDPFFILGLTHNRRTSGAMYLTLVWWPGLTIEGPLPGQHGGREWQSPVDIPVGRWFNIETRHVCAGDFTGSIRVWQDGVQIFDLEGVKTRYDNGNCSWSVNNYGTKITPSPVVIYVDDAAISKTRIGQ